MAYEFRAAGREDAPAVKQLLHEAFQAPPDAPGLDARFLAWKHTDEGTWWPGSRSYLLVDGARVVAHGAAWPVRLRTSAGMVDAYTLIDWVARRGAAGAGVAFVNHMAKLTPVVFSISGTKMTQALMPRIGFPCRGNVPLFARVLRPWKQFQVRPGVKSAGAVTRLLRNAFWATEETVPVAGWRAEETGGVVDLDESAFPDAVASVHDRSFVDWIRRCPPVKVQTFALSDRGTLRGYALTAIRDGQSRILDVRIGGENPDDWNRAFSCLLEAARRDPDVCEAVVCVSHEPLIRAVLANGFHRRIDRPLWVRDEAGVLGPDPKFLLSSLDADDAFLPSPEWPFAT